MAYSLSGERPVAAAYSFNPVSGLLRILAKLRAARVQRLALAELLELDEFRLYDLGISRQDVVSAIHNPGQNPGETLNARRAANTVPSAHRATNFG
jgi:uncharacterized protein YjiS (DUF1127 family)